VNQQWIQTLISSAFGGLIVLVGQLYMERLREHRNNRQKKTQIYNSVLNVAGKNLVVDWSPPIKFEIGLYREQIREKLYEGWDLIDEPVRKLVKNLDGELITLYYQGNPEDPHDVVPLANLFNEMISTIDDMHSKIGKNR